MSEPPEAKDLLICGWEVHSGAGAVWKLGQANWGATAVREEVVDWATGASGASWEFWPVDWGSTAVGDEVVDLGPGASWELGPVDWDATAGWKVEVDSVGHDEGE